MGINPKVSIQAAPKRKDVFYDTLPYPGIGTLGLQIE
jgi:hypothetical protein